MTGTESSGPPIPEGLAREIARQGEVRLAAMTSLATAADLRATTLCGIFGAAAVALGAAVLTIAVAAHPDGRLLWAGSVACAGFFGSALIAAIAGAPSDFFVGGANPDTLRNWAWANGDGWSSEGGLLDATGARYAASIAFNGGLLDRSASRIVGALALAGASPFLALIAFFAAHT